MPGTARLDGRGEWRVDAAAATTMSGTERACRTSVCAAPPMMDRKSTSPDAASRRAISAMSAAPSPPSVSSSPEIRAPTTKSRPDLAADLPEHLEGEAHAVVQAPAVLVRPTVEERRPELVHEVVVGEGQLHAVEPALAAAPRGVAERPHEHGDLLGLELVRHLAVDLLGDLRRAPGARASPRLSDCARRPR